MSKKTISNILLLITAMIWGTAFVAQKVGLDYLGPFSFNGLRFIIGAIALFPLMLVMKKLNAESNTGKTSFNATNAERENLIPKFPTIQKFPLKGGFICGLVVLGATTLQQIGLIYTDAGKAGFITALYIVLVPILSIFLGKKVPKIIWFCVFITAIGLSLLCVPEEGLNLAQLNLGDILIFISAFLFALHIIVIDRFSSTCDGISLSFVQFVVAGIIGTIPIMIFENITFAAIRAGILPLLFVGVLSCAVAYTLQIIAQKNTEPSTASLIMSTESIFAVITSILLLHETISLKEGLGCLIIFIAIILAQLPSKEDKSSIEQNT